MLSRTIKKNETQSNTRINEKVSGKYESIYLECASGEKACFYRMYTLKKVEVIKLT